MSKEDRQRYAKKIKSDIMSQWNHPKDAGDGKLGQIGSGKDAGVQVVFDVNVVEVMESELEGLMSGEFDESKNFVQLVDGGGSDMEGGYYGQIDINDLNSRGTSTAAHEYGHMLGYFVDKGVPTSKSPGYNLLDNDSHAYFDEEGYIMNRKHGQSDEQLSNRHVQGIEFSRLNGGQGLRFPTHNGANGSGKVMIVNPNKPKEYYKGQYYPTVLKE